MKRLHDWLNQLNLWPRMALSISIGFVFLLLAFWFLGERALRESSDRILEERLAITQVVANQIDNRLVQAKRELEESSKLAPFDPQNSDLTAEMEVMAAMFTHSSYFSYGVLFTDSAGKSLLSYPQVWWPPGTELATHSFVAAALSSHSPTYSDPFVLPDETSPVLALAQPVIRDDQFLGLLIGLMELSNSSISEPLEEATVLGQTAHAVLVDPSGYVIYSTFGLPFQTPGEHVTFYRQALAGGNPVVETVPFELDLPGEPLGHLHVMAFVPLEHIAWGVAIGGDVDTETFAAVYRLRLGLALIGLTALAGTWGATLFGTRLIVRPVHQLTAAASEIAEGDLQRPLIIEDGGEIGAMAQALEKMRQQLLRNIGQLSDWNEHLENKVSEQTKELDKQQRITRHLLHRTITAQEEERTRIARELHDECGQTLIAIEMGLASLTQHELAPAAKDVLERSRQLTEQSIGELRRMVNALRPGVLDQFGLVSSIDWVSKQLFANSQIRVEINATDQPLPLNEDEETVLFRIAQEAMSNVARHSQAKNVTIRLVAEPAGVRLTIQDDGRGYDIERQGAAGPSQRMGLASIRERAALINASVMISPSPGQGTLVDVLVPAIADSSTGTRH